VSVSPEGFPPRIRRRLLTFPSFQLSSHWRKRPFGGHNQYQGGWTRVGVLTSCLHAKITNGSKHTTPRMYAFLYRWFGGRRGGCLYIPFYQTFAEQFS